MAENIVQVSEGTGKKLHTWDTTIGANLVQDEFVIPGEYPYASYVVMGGSIATNTANDHLVQIMAGASLKVRIRRIRIDQIVNATTATTIAIDIVRLTTAGTGGTVLTPRPLDPADAASGCTAMTLPTAKGTEGNIMQRIGFNLRQAVSATSSQVDDFYEWVPAPNAKGIVIAAGTTNGIAIKTLNGFGAAGSVNVMVDVVETSF